MFKIRDTVEGDLDAICALSDQVNAYHHHNLPRVFYKPDGSEREKSFWQDRLNEADSTFFIVETEAGVQGFINAKIMGTTDIPFLVDQKICRIGTIVVDETLQRKGVGKALMAKIEQWAVEMNADELRLGVMEFNANARLFYESLGYETQLRNLSKTLKD